jgi:hypothetical protein
MWCRLPTAEEFAAIVAANRVTNAPLACPACASAPGVDCAPECPLYELSRELEPCDECNGDARLCDCFMRYAPEPELQPCPACRGSGRVLYAREVEDGCDECEATGRVTAKG